MAMGMAKALAMEPVPPGPTTVNSNELDTRDPPREQALDPGVPQQGVGPEDARQRGINKRLNMRYFRPSNMPRHPTNTEIDNVNDMKDLFKKGAGFNEPEIQQELWQYQKPRDPFGQNN